MLLRRSLLAAAGAALATPSLAQDRYPNRPVRMIIPVGVGGVTDIVGRIICEALTPILGQPVVPENVVGAGSTIGAAKVARAQPDGHTLLLNHIGMATIPTLYRKLPFNVLNDFEFLASSTTCP